MSKIKRNGCGFTLIELMLVSAIIGFLVAIAVPKFANLVIRARESVVKGHLGAIRSAISIYYSDNEGWYPEMALEFSLQPKYFSKFPIISIPTVPEHVSSSRIYSVGSNAFPAIINGLCIDFGDCGFPPGGTMAWVYNAHGGLFSVNCSHPDSRGNNWDAQ